jgi:hypothetical protein
VRLDAAVLERPRRHVRLSSRRKARWFSAPAGSGPGL